MSASSTMQVKMGGRVISPSNTTPPRHPASVFKPGAKATFFDLPVETRLQIYGYILEEHSPIALTIIRRHGAPREVARRANQRDKHHRGLIWNREDRIWVAAPPTYTALIFVNRQVYTEATEILYGNNAFQFSSTTALKDFLEHLGQRARHLRYISIDAGGYVFSSIRAALGYLQQAKGLKKLEFAHKDFCTTSNASKPITTPIRLILDCTGLLKTLHAVYKSRKLSGSVLNLVSIAGNTPCRVCSPKYFTDPRGYDRYGSQGDCNCVCADADKIHESLCASIRSRIAKVLRISEDKGDQGK
ncbi:hypothetical protein M409DRAFT_55960 [Zasmidium cellare ATCC 36951]|uniref:DUF7730 domain-containing protein n=1 Tax=Zasmidium cellare ATCC 36951 TaxID=1080233 RepID=A0A6A6CFP1_ZASCE|nr:uncharacterized protein M409DRAFT_55960 [Zasmidium cellare ATCC 36951]KAF2165060.1 hypothetical protein M409DRAFT_55960 [Zasmidium cellare ATCC 36951]